MVRPELVRHLLLLAQSVEKVRVALDLTARVREDQVVRAAQTLEKMQGDLRWCDGFRLFVAILIAHGQGLLVPFDQDSQFTVRGFRLHQGDRCPLSRTQEIGRQAHVAQCCRKTYARRPAPDDPLDAVHQGLKLFATL